MSIFSPLSHWFISIISHFPCQKPSKDLFFSPLLFLVSGLRKAYRLPIPEKRQPLILLHQDRPRPRRRECCYPEELNSIPRQSELLSAIFGELRCSQRKYRLFASMTVPVSRKKPRMQDCAARTRFISPGDDFPDAGLRSEPAWMFLVLHAESADAEAREPRSYVFGSCGAEKGSASPPQTARSSSFR